MRLYLIRHAHAGQRLPGGRDRYRPLRPDGRARAEALVDLFDGLAIDRLLASPATRCQQTLGALAHARGLEIEENPDLWEGMDTRRTLTELTALTDEHVVACSHGDIIPALLDQLAARGVPLAGRGCELGSVWILDREAGEAWTSGRYVSPRREALEPR